MPHIYTTLKTAIFLIVFFACSPSTPNQETETLATAANQPLQVVTGAERTTDYLPLLQGKKVGMVVNNTSTIGTTHLVDSLISLGVTITKIFAPEHGFRGEAPAGEKISNDIDAKTGIPIISLYGNHYKPTTEEMAGLEVVVFDIQDVGARFYTYTSTMSYAMEACAENKVKFIVFDRPNPIGNMVDGPVLEEAQESFVGLHPVPIAYGLTIGEYATMINNEGWLANGVKVELEVVELRNWDHNTAYSLPIKPSPNLTTDNSIAWYPSTCLFEGTMMSLGRGTQFPFEVLGYPSPDFGDFQFTPVPIPGMSMDPKHQDKVCFGIDLRQAPAPGKVDISYLIDFYKKAPRSESFFNSYFELLAGNSQLRQQIEQGLTEEEIRASWQEKLLAYKQIRKQHLLYADFE